MYPGWKDKRQTVLYFKKQDFQNKLSGSFEVQEKKINQET